MQSNERMKSFKLQRELSISFEEMESSRNEHYADTRR